MSYVLRDRPDGQVEIVLSRPVLVGVFPERAVAEQVCSFLKDVDPPLADNELAIFGRGAAEVMAAAPVDLDAVADEIAPRKARRTGSAARRTQLPAVVDEKPTPAVQKGPEPHSLSEAEVQAAFARIQNGEKIYAVATDFGLTMGQLRGMWANHKRHAQKYMASGGQQPCRLCQRSFTPSISHPDTCARCSHD